VSASLVITHPIQPTVEEVVVPMQSPINPTLLFEGDVSPGLVVMHPIQPTVEEVVAPVKSLVNPTLLLEADVSFTHVINISNIAPSEQERNLLSPSTLP
jgi:hypothetical protein